MERAYYLIVEQDAGGRRLRTIDDYSSPDRLVSDAADYEGGEYPGRWVGGLRVEFDVSGRLVSAQALEGLGRLVSAELASRTGWRRSQAALERWASR